MGIWFFATAVGEFLSAKIGSLMSVPEEFANNPVRSLPYYSDILSKIAIGSIAVGLLLVFFVPMLRKWMKEIK